MATYLMDLVRARELLFTWTLRDFKVRYSQSILGAAWAILQPLLLMVIFTLVFSIFIRIPTQGVPYPLFAYTALLPWTLFANSLSTAIPSLVDHMNLVGKIHFPPFGIAAFSVLPCSHCWDNEGDEHAGFCSHGQRHCPRL